MKRGINVKHSPRKRRSLSSNSDRSPLRIKQKSVQPLSPRKGLMVGEKNTIVANKEQSAKLILKNGQEFHGYSFGADTVRTYLGERERERKNTTQSSPVSTINNSSHLIRI